MFYIWFTSRTEILELCKYHNLNRVLSPSVCLEKMLIKWSNISIWTVMLPIVTALKNILYRLFPWPASPSHKWRKKSKIDGWDVEKLIINWRNVLIPGLSCSENLGSDIIFRITDLMYNVHLLAPLLSCKRTYFAVVELIFANSV